jgi:hypothetical protein
MGGPIVLNKLSVELGLETELDLSGLLWARHAHRSSAGPGLLGQEKEQRYWGCSASFVLSTASTIEPQMPECSVWAQPLLLPSNLPGPCSGSSGQEELHHSPLHCKLGACAQVQSTRTLGEPVWEVCVPGGCQGGTVCLWGRCVHAEGVSSVYVT